jgi:hypothetical protein
MSFSCQLSAVRGCVVLVSVGWTGPPAALHLGCGGTGSGGSGGGCSFCILPRWQQQQQPLGKAALRVGCLFSAERLLLHPLVWCAPGVVCEAAASDVGCQ